MPWYVQIILFRTSFCTRCYFRFGKLKRRTQTYVELARQ